MKQTSEGALAGLISHKNEPVKQFIELDGEGRPFKVFTAHFMAKDNDACFVTQYEYAGAGSTIIVKRNEYVGTWVSATMNSTHSDVPDASKN